MRIAFLADGRAENFRRMVRYFATTPDEVLVLSTYPCEQEGLVGRLQVLPAVLSVGNALVKSSTGITTRGDPPAESSRIYRFAKLLYPAWQNTKLVNVAFQARAAQRALARFKPDVVLAFRTQNEGYIAALVGQRPWVLFAQGSDFGYFARDYPLHRAATRAALTRTDGLIADCDRDIRLARDLGLPSRAPTLVMPGNGGVDRIVYQFGLPAERREKTIIYPRGIAPYLRLDTLLAAAQLTLARNPRVGVRFVLLVQPAMIALAEAEVAKFDLSDHAVMVRPFLSQPQLSSLLQKAAAIVSPSLTDGTPNSMLEAMACGALPIMGELESIREWIQHGSNGLLFEQSRPEQLAECIQRALDDMDLRRRAQECNLQLVQERADYRTMMPAAREFILNFVRSGSPQ
jgi:glycosyltransferase involved in cell wall biosynthesis